VRGLLDRFRQWKEASLLRRTVVTVAAFVMMTCVSIATMSYAATTATKAVFPPSPAPSSSGMPGPSAGPADGENKRVTKTASMPSRGAVPQRAAVPNAHTGDE
jgi:hypothetical protein